MLYIYCLNCYIILLHGSVIHLLSLTVDIFNHYYFFDIYSSRSSPLLKMFFFYSKVSEMSKRIHELEKENADLRRRILMLESETRLSSNPAFPTTPTQVSTILILYLSSPVLSLLSNSSPYLALPGSALFCCA